MSAEHDDEGCALALHFAPELPCAADTLSPPATVSERMFRKYRDFLAGLSPDETNLWRSTSAVR